VSGLLFWYSSIPGTYNVHSLPLTFFSVRGTGPYGRLSLRRRLVRFHSQPHPLVCLQDLYALEEVLVCDPRFRRCQQKFLQRDSVLADEQFPLRFESLVKRIHPGQTFLARTALDLYGDDYLA